MSFYEEINKDSEKELAAAVDLVECKKYCPHDYLTCELIYKSEYCCANQEVHNVYRKPQDSW